jgi:hypothetical protein
MWKESSWRSILSNPTLMTIKSHREKKLIRKRGGKS